MFYSFLFEVRDELLYLNSLILNKITFSTLMVVTEKRGDSVLGSPDEGLYILLSLLFLTVGFLGVLLVKKVSRKGPITFSNSKLLQQSLLDVKVYE